MNSKDKLIISKLIEVVAKQQKIIAKFAQAADPNIQHLSMLWNVIGSNSPDRMWPGQKIVIKSPIVIPLGDNKYRLDAQVPTKQISDYLSNAFKAQAKKNFPSLNVEVLTDVVKDIQ